MRLSGAAVLLFAATCALGSAGERLSLDGVVAHVNDHGVTLGEVEILAAPAVRQLRTVYSGDELADRIRKAYRDALNLLIEPLLILDAYQAQEMRIPDWAVDRRIDEIVHDTFKDDRSKLMDVLAGQDRTFEEWREEIRKQIVVSFMRSERVNQYIRISPAAINREYEDNRDLYRVPAQVKLLMIEFKKSAGQEPRDIRERAEQVRKDLLDGSDFAGLAGEYTTDESHADKGGDWGWVEPTALFGRELSTAALALKPSQISEIIETREGFYLIKSGGRREESLKPLEDVQSEIEKSLRGKQARKLYDAWISRLRGEAYIRILATDLFAE